MPTAGIHSRLKMTHRKTDNQQADLGVSAPLEMPSFPKSTTNHGIQEGKEGKGSEEEAAGN